MAKSIKKPVGSKKPVVSKKPAVAPKAAAPKKPTPVAKPVAPKPAAKSSQPSVKVVAKKPTPIAKPVAPKKAVVAKPVVVATKPKAQKPIPAKPAITFPKGILKVGDTIAVETEMVDMPTTEKDSLLMEKVTNGGKGIVDAPIDIPDAVVPVQKENPTTHTLKSFFVSNGKAITRQSTIFNNPTTPSTIMQQILALPSDGKGKSLKENNLVFPNSRLYTFHIEMNLDNPHPCVLWGNDIEACMRPTCLDGNPEDFADKKILHLRLTSDGVAREAQMETSLICQCCDAETISIKPGNCPTFAVGNNCTVADIEAFNGLCLNDIGRLYTHVQPFTVLAIQLVVEGR